MNHTKEPWHVCDGLISSEKKEAIALVEHSGMNGPVSPTGSANARRIIACVNACSDIPSDKLDGLATMARLGIELSDAINDPDGRFNRLEKEHYANEFSLEKAGISGEACETKVSKGIELLTAQRDELLAALKERTGFYYERNVPHQFSLPHCLCRECTDKRCDSALANIEAKK